MSYTTNRSTRADAGETAETDRGLKSGHGVPTYWGVTHPHFTRGLPKSSTRTAVPACNTDCSVVALPLAKPWLVTRVSARSCIGVSVPMYVAMSALLMPSTPAHAAALS